MKSSAEVLKSLHGRTRWHAALERRHPARSLTLRDYVAALRPTAEALAEAVCALDTSGAILYANPAFQRMVGRAEPALLDQRVCDFGHCRSASDARFRRHRPQDYASPEGALWCDALTTGGSLEFDACDWLRPDGSLVQGRGSLRPIVHEGRTLGYTLIASHMSDPAGPDAALPDAARQSEAMRKALREVVQTERRLRLVEAVGDIALAQLPLDSLLHALIDGIRREMELENVSILLVNDAGDTVTAHVATGAGAEVTRGSHVPYGDGVVGEAMRTRRAVFIPNEQQLRERMASFTPEMRAHMNLQSLLMVPLIVEDHPIGAISVGASEPNHFTAEDARLIELVGERVALAIERAHANEEAMRAHERLRFLNDASGALNATLDYHDITQRLATILTPALSDACAIYLLEEDGLLRKVATQAPAPGLLTPDPVATALQRVVEQLAPTVEAQPDDIASPIGRSVQLLASVIERRVLPGVTNDGAEATCACFCTPLVIRQHALGTLYLAVRPGKEFSVGDLELIQGLAERAAVAIDNARLYLETQQALASGSATATQLDTIFDATDVGIFVTDANGEFLRVNPYGAHLLGITAQDLVKHDGLAATRPYELRTPEGETIPSEREPVRLARVLGRPVEQRVVIHRPDGSKDVQALARCTPWLDARNQIAGTIGVFTDITAITELERQKDEFLGIASHELKTPLTSLKILAQLLARKMQASGEIRDLEQALRMQVSIKRMERLINDLLDVSRIQEGKLALNMELTDLGALCADAISEQELLTQRDIRYSDPSDGPLLVYADPERIHQVLTNLLSNALKYSPEAEPVVVRARATTDECIISVEDHGSGVPPEAIDHIFDRFFRVPGMQVQSGSGVGLGLGLSISREIVERHGGRIWVESKLGHGSAFLVALPRASDVTPGAPAATCATP